MDFAEMELGRESRRNKCLGRILKCWYNVMFLETEELIKRCYEWQKCNVGIKSWAMEGKRNYIISDWHLCGGIYKNVIGKKCEG
jgi:hypothetical protein